MARKTKKAEEAKQESAETDTTVNENDPRPLILADTILKRWVERDKVGCDSDENYPAYAAEYSDGYLTVTYFTDVPVCVEVKCGLDVEEAVLEEELKTEISMRRVLGTKPHQDAAADATDKQ